jgi:hydrogenase maturation protease
MNHNLLILGLGNPILRDDRVGHDVADAVHKRLPKDYATLRVVSVGGIELLHVLEGFSHVLIVDAITPGKLAPGEVREVTLAEMGPGASPLTLHNASLVTCLELGRRVGLPMPEEVKIFAVGVADPYTFDECCTPQVADALPGVIDFVYEQVFGRDGCWSLERAIAT